MSKFSLFSIAIGLIAFFFLMSRIGLDSAIDQVLVWIAALGMVIPVLKYFFDGFG